MVQKGGGIVTLPPGRLADRGQRYEIVCRDRNDNRVVLGWSDDHRAFREMVELHPSLQDREAIDRGTRKEPTP